MKTICKSSDARTILNGEWTLARVDGDIVVPLNVPGDVHSALLAANEITDPYWRDTEVTLDWVHEGQWDATKEFDANPQPGERYTISFDTIDCNAIITLNGSEVGQSNSQFLRWDFDVTDALKQGKNQLNVRFLSNSEAAIKASAASDISMPYLEQNNRLAHFNYLRKTQCHAGWDWNIALSPLGLYGDVVLRRTDTMRFDDLIIRQEHNKNSVTVEAELVFQVNVPCEADAELTIDGKTETITQSVYPGENRLKFVIDLTDPKLWWPFGSGEQHLYDVAVRLGDETKHLKLGLRDIHLDTSADDIGNRFAFRVNGRDIFMCGANWIPADALPERGSYEVVRDLLQSAIDANMNMLRVWGGGQYEADWFYDLCDEMGILIWQDFMFACNTYPAHQRQWLDLVRQEAKQQIRRLSSHACIAIWCGDNELVGALGWFEDSKADRDRYVAIYDRLNHALEEEVENEAPGIPFWSSSPSVGRLNFGDGWHIDTSGDMHFWDVWHSAKDFEHYRTVRPRFCSEFGFQSFPSMKTIETFTDPKDRNVSSKVMEVHQRNDGGNSRIVETIQRYFQFPDSFEDMVYLSQLGQGLAMKTSIEFWRSNKPRTMGTLYWQLNDTWPVASWASLEYKGGWKSTHYMARRFYAPVMVTAQPDAETGDIVVWAVNDTGAPVSLTVGLRSVDVSGEMDTIDTVSAVCPPDRAVEIKRIPANDLPDSAFLHFAWTDTERLHTGENEYLPKRPKEYDFGDPNITCETSGEGADLTVTLTSDRPALYVTYDHGGSNVYSDNCFTLLPGLPKTISIKRMRADATDTSQATISYMKG